MIPYGVTNSLAKIAPNGTFHWQEIARLKVPASEIVNGNILYVALDVTVETQVAMPALKSFLRISPAEEWDAALTTNFNSGQPAGRISVTIGTAAVSTCKKSVMQHRRSTTMTRSSTHLTINDPASGTYTSGLDITNATAFTGTSTQGHAIFPKTAATDLELVLVALVTATAGDFRSYGFNFTAYAAAP